MCGTFTCSTNSSHHRSSPTHRTAHWTSTGLPPRTSHRPAFCFGFSLSFLVDTCVGLNWLIAGFFLSHVSQIASFIHSFIHPFIHLKIPTLVHFLGLGTLFFYESVFSQISQMFSVIMFYVFLLVCHCCNHFIVFSSFTVFTSF